jgi:hypothetical protein
MTTIKQRLQDIQQKAQERTVKTQNIEYDLETLVKKIKKNVIKLDPEYQRRHRWDKDTSSRLIESLILNIPIPLIYISQDVDVDEEIEDDIARFSVIDGQQRLTAIVEFLSNKFQLSGLTVLDDLNDCSYKDLPPFLIRRLEERTIRCLRVDSTVDAQVKYDIFERLNSGAVKLEAQELRNAVLRGKFNKLIKRLAQNEDFRILLQIDRSDPESSKKVQRMEDVELVLRFFALIGDGYKRYKKGFKQFLNDEMKKFNSLKDDNISKFEFIFTKTMSIINTNFGDKSFAKYRLEKDRLVKMSNFNAAVYDALSVAVAEKVVDNSLPLDKSAKSKFLNLFKEEKFFNSVHTSINDSAKLVYRIDSAKKVL